MKREEDQEWSGLKKERSPILDLVKTLPDT